MNASQFGQLTALVDRLTAEGYDLSEEQAKLLLAGRGNERLREQAVATYRLLCRAMRNKEAVNGG